MKYLIYLGLNDKETKRQKISTEKVYDKVYELVGDSTIQEVNGYYQGIKEKTFIITKYEEENYDIKGICEKLNKAFNQECTIFEKFVSNSEFVY